MEAARDTEMETINTRADEQNQPELGRSFSVDSNPKSNSKLSLFLTFILWILVIYSVIMSTYALFTINSNKTTCSCSTADVESALTKLNIGILTSTTSSPTIPPSKAVTKSPTALPSVNPSVAPSKYPTVSPSQVPTLSPTIFPSMNPSAAPSKYPTISPSQNPTVEPTFMPTMEPTTSQPTYFPTLLPTLMPTMPIIYGWADKTGAPDQQFSPGDGVTISFQNIRVGNDANILDTTINQGRFTAPISGVYLFTVAVYSDAAPTSHIWYTYNGAQQESFTSSPAATGYEESLWTGTVMIEITENDYIEFQFYDPNFGGTVTIKENWLHTYVKWTLIQAF